MRRTPAARAAAPKSRAARAVVVLERAGRAHRVDEVVGGVDARERRVERERVEHVAAHDLGRRSRRAPRSSRGRRARQRTRAARLERREQPPADVARGAGDEDEAVHRSNGVYRNGFSRAASSGERSSAARAGARERRGGGQRAKVRDWGVPSPP